MNILAALPVVAAACLAAMPHGNVRFSPPALTVERDSTGYVQARVRMYSQHGDSIRITRVEGSCRCATASVQQSLAADTSAARIYLAINARHFTDSVNAVDYTVEHTGAGSPATFRVLVTLPR